MVFVGCGGGEKTDSDESAPAQKPVLLVPAAKAEVQPMKNELRLLGKTVATRHVIIRAPTPGRVIGLKLASGDSVRKGQVVAHVINRETEAAEAGLEVARKIDPQSADSLTKSVGRYDHSAGNEKGEDACRTCLTGNHARHGENASADGGTDP